MGIQDVNVDLSGTLRTDRAAGTRAGSAANAESKASTPQDFFENSGRLGQVRALIDVLVQAPEIRTDVVERAKALLESGELDSRQRAERAAEGLTEGRPPAFDEA